MKRGIVNMRTVCILAGIFTSITLSGHADQLPEPIQGTVDGVIMYTSDSFPDEYFVIGVQNDPAWRGHFCSCHVGNSASVESGEIRLSFWEDDAISIAIRFPQQKQRFRSDLLDETSYSQTIHQDKTTVSYIHRVHTPIELHGEYKTQDTLILQPGSILVFRFHEIYEDQFKR